jgi:hypothetical protein
MALVDALADRWGVQLHPDRKVTWCELATGLNSTNGHVRTPGVMRAEALLDLYLEAKSPRESSPGRLSAAIAVEAMIGVITDFLHWLRAHGCDPDEVLDCAQTPYEAQVSATADVM